MTACLITGVLIIGMQSSNMVPYTVVQLKSNKALFLVSNRHIVQISEIVVGTEEIASKHKQRDRMFDLFSPPSVLVVLTTKRPLNTTV